jgi:hypothetical protein
MRKGQITLATVIAGFAIVGSILGFGNYFNSKIEATNKRVGETEGDVKALNAKVDFLVDIAGGKFNQNTGKVEIQEQAKITNPLIVK